MSMFIDKERILLSSFKFEGKSRYGKIELNEIKDEDKQKYLNLVKEMSESDKAFTINKQIFKHIKFQNPIKITVDFDFDIVQILTKEDEYYSTITIEQGIVNLRQSKGRYKVKIDGYLFNSICSSLEGNIYIKIIGNDSPIMFYSEWRERKKDDFGYIHRQEWIIVAPIVD